MNNVKVTTETLITISLSCEVYDLKGEILGMYVGNRI